MNQELSQYKANRLSDLKKIYNANCISVTQYYNNIINIISKSRAINKAKQVNTVKNLLAASISNLTKKYNTDCLTIQNFTPKQIKIDKAKKALLVGINYTGTSSELYGCINDVNCIKERISSKGFTSINTITDLTTKKPTRGNILSEFKSLLINSQAGDLLFFLYSGHGSYDLDRNGDEADGYDELIVSSDSKGISDDELKTIIQQNLKQDVTLFAMFDSCFSGSVLDLRYQYMDSLNYDKYTENDKQAVTVGNVFMISGCTDEQTSADAVFNNKPNGAMTWSLLESLKQKPNDSWRELVKNMRDILKTSEFDQIPQFSSGSFVNIDSPVFI
jgi:hypothetical protein